MQSAPGDRRRMPYFFLSYAHTPRVGPDSGDPDIWVSRLFNDLCGNIMQLTSVPAGDTAGFMDTELRSGDGWGERLSEALATCRVFVPLYSPRYFASETCGREWYAFAQRRLLSGLPEEGSAIVPALWVPTSPGDLPQVARRIQYVDSACGEDYVNEGLYGLVKLRYLRQEYERAVYVLARSIVRTAQEKPVEPGRPVYLQDMPSAFGTSDVPRRLRIVVVAPTRSELPSGRSADHYGDFSVDWNPYSPVSVRPLADFTADLVAQLDYRVSRLSFDDAAAEVLGGNTGSEPTVMLIDRWALGNGQRRDLLRRMDSRVPPWFSAIVPWNRNDPDNDSAEAPGRAELEETLPRVMQQGRTVQRVAINGVPTLEAFGAILPQVVQWAVVNYLKHATAHPPAGPASPRPRLRGPMQAPVTSDDPSGHGGRRAEAEPDD